MKADIWQHPTDGFGLIVAYGLGMAGGAEKKGASFFTTLLTPQSSFMYGKGHT